MANGSEVFSERFVLSYEGPALAENRMAVRDLAPALLALGDLAHQAQRFAEPLAPQISLDVTAFEHGSFGAELAMVVRHVMDTMSSDPASAVANVFQITIGTFMLGKWLHRHPQATKSQLGRGQVRYSDPATGTTQVFNNSVVNFYEQNPGARSAARDVVKPLKQEGVDRLVVKQGDEVLAEVDKDDIEAFEVPEGEPLVDEEATFLLRVVAPSFVSGTKWRLNDGYRTFWAAIVDDGFWDRVNERRDLFGAGDTLRARVRYRQWEGESGSIRTEWEVVEVLEHRGGGGPIPGQLAFPDETNSE